VRLATLTSVALASIFCAGISLLAFAQHDAYHTHGRDLGIYVQVAWSITHGTPFETSLLKYNTSHLAEHLALVMVPLGLLYALFPTPKLLLLAQQVALAGAGIPIYLLATRRLGHPLPGLLLQAGYYAMPALSYVALQEFHAVGIPPLPLAFAIYFALSGRMRWAAGLGFAALLVEEQGGLIVIGLGLLMALRGARRLGLALSATAVAWTALIVLVIMPSFNLPETLDDQGGNRTADHFMRLRREPIAQGTRYLTERVPDAFAALVVPTGGAALLAPEVAALALPTATMLIANDGEGMYRKHWSAPMLPIPWLAAAWGLGRLRRRPWQAGALALMVAASAYSYRAGSFFPGGGEWNPARFTRTPHMEDIDRLLATIPPDVPVTASTALTPHLAHRETILIHPIDVYVRRVSNRTPYFAIDLSPDIYHLAEPWQVKKELRLPSLSADYSIVIAQGMVVASTDPVPPAVPRSATFGPIGLDGYGADCLPERWRVRLHWRAVEKPGRRLSRTVRLVDGSGAELQRIEGDPIGEAYAPDRWPKGQAIIEDLYFAAPAGASRLFRLLATWYEADGRPLAPEVEVGSLP